MPLEMFSVKEKKKMNRERMRLKKRRVERAIEKAQHEEEMALLARERARAEFQEWEKKEEHVLWCYSDLNILFSFSSIVQLLLSCYLSPLPPSPLSLYELFYEILLSFSPLLFLFSFYELYLECA